MTDTKQPEALRLAAWLKLNSAGIYRPAAEAAEVLREQHARIAALEAENRTLKEQHEAIGAGGVTGLRVKAVDDAYPTLPPRPKPDDFIIIRMAGRPVEINAYRDSTMEAFALACIDADRAQRTAIAQEGGK